MKTITDGKDTISFLTGDDMRKAQEEDKLLNEIEGEGGVYNELIKVSEAWKK